MTLLDHIGNWNPQLLREIKGRLNGKTVGVTLVLTLMGQMLFLGMAYSMLPFDGGYSDYCVQMVSDYSSCARDAAGNVLIDWQRWWTHLLRVLNWLIMVTVMLTGTLLLSNDLSQEDQRGTLDAIRLSPQPSHKFFLGKLLGIPMLLYWVIALILPLHVVTAVNAEATGFLIGFYSLLVGGCLMLFSMAMLLGMLAKRHGSKTDYASSSAIAIVTMLLTLFGFLPIFLIWNINTTWNLQRPFILPGEGVSGLRWYGLPLSGNWVTSYALTLAIFGIATVWLWRSLDRRFHRPAATLLSKAQSYGVVTSVQGLLLGLFVGHFEGVVVWERVFGFLIMTLAIFLGVMVALATSRQAVLDWARYRHRQTSARRSLVRDLFWNDDSPMIGAIVVNLVITAAFVLVWLLQLSDVKDRAHLMLSVLLALSAIALYAIVAQLMLLSKAPGRAGFALLSVISLIATPLMVAAIQFSNKQEAAARIWLLFTPVPMLASLAQPYVPPLSTLMLALLGQWGAFVLLSIGLTLKLRQMGATSTQALFTSARSAQRDA